MIDEKLFPKHEASLHLEHNEHKAYYQRADAWIMENAERCTWESNDAIQRAIDTDSIWVLQWYPNTPIGFNCVAAPTLTEVLALAKKVEAKD